MHTISINFQVPQGWHELSDKQLRYVYQLLADDFANEEAANEAQTQTVFVCISDIDDGYTELNNTPRTRRVKTVFFAMRHAAANMFRMKPFLN